MSATASECSSEKDEDSHHEDEFNKFLPVFENYQKARLSFVQGVVELTCDTDLIPDLIEAGAIPMLCPLIFDEVTMVKNAALFAIGKLANQRQEVAEEIVKRNIIPLLIDKLRVENKRLSISDSLERNLYTRSAIYIFRAISKHSCELAKQLVDARVLGTIKIYLSDLDPKIKEYAAWTVANIAQHTRDLANAVALDEAGLLQALVNGLSDSEMLVKKVTVSAIYEIVKHSEQLAQTVAQQEKVVPILTQMFSEPDERLRHLILPTLTRLGGQGDTGENVTTDNEVLQFSVEALVNDDPVVAKNAAVHLLETAKDSEEVIKSAIKSGTLEAMTTYMQKRQNGDLLPVLNFISNAASTSEDIAGLIVDDKELLSKFSHILNSDAPSNVKEECASAIGHLGSYSTKLANEIGEANLLTILSSLSENPDVPLSLQTKCKESLKNVLEQCVHLPTLESLLNASSTEILDIALSQCTKTLHSDGAARKEFVVNGSLKKLLEIKPEPGSLSEKAIQVIRMCFPPDVIKMNSASFLEEILSKVEGFTPGSGISSPARGISKARLKTPAKIVKESESGSTSS